MLEVEGLVQGSIVALAGKEALVRILGKGRVEGEIHAPFAVINGAVRGDVHCTTLLELAPRARVQGNVFYAQVEMAAGSEVNGNLTHVEAPVAQAGHEGRLAAEHAGQAASV